MLSDMYYYVAFTLGLNFIFIIFLHFNVLKILDAMFFTSVSAGRYW